MTNQLPNPCDLGAPTRFKSWRYGQELAVNRLLDGDRRFSAHAMPTGSGKSLVALVYPLLTNLRAVYLTSTKGLEDQLVREFSETGLVDVRGMSNYQCKGLIDGYWPEQLQYWRLTNGARQPTVEDGPCHGGLPCHLKDRGCGYYDAIRVARNSRLVVTNYSFWMSSNKWSEGLGDFDLLILDEAHETPDELSGFLRTEISEFDLTLLGVDILAGADAASQRGWSVWASAQWKKADQKAAELYGIVTKKKEYRRMQDLARRLDVLRKMDDTWIPEKGDRCWTFEPKWPAGHAESNLFLDIDKVVLMSATMRPKTLDLLGIKQEEREFFEYPSPFPAGRRPVIHVPTCRVNFRTTPSEMRWWAARIDNIISGRLDRKGIIHTVSYDRAKYIALNSEHHDIMFLPTGRNTREMVEAFKAAPAPAVLVSPAVSTGWDFPYEMCEYQIIGKLAFPDTRSAVMQARSEEDRDFPSYLAMIQLVQASGRGMRAADDICETIIIDDNIGWFMQKNKHFAPDWFLQSMSRRDIVPQPPPKLAERRS